MEIEAVLKWLEALPLAARIREGLYLFPMLESVHVVSFALVVGTIAAIDLRLLGLASAGRPFRRMASEILKWTWAAFAVTALTGVLMFLTNAGVYYHNFYFRTKIVLLALAGLNVLVFEFTAGRTVEQWERTRSAPPAGRAVGALSLAIWIGVIVAGRFIGFTTSRATMEPAPAPIDFEELFQGSPAPHQPQR